MTQRFYLSLLTFIILTLSACDPSKLTSVTKPAVAPDIKAVEAENAGDYLAAAELYLALANKSVEQQQADYYLKAAWDFWQAYQSDRAAETLAKVIRGLLSPSHRADAGILEAHLALEKNQAKQALRALEFDTHSLLNEQNKQVLELRVKAYELTGNGVGEAISLIALAPLLSNAEQGDNQAATWQALMTLTPQDLDLFNPGVPPETGSGWFSLAYIIKAYKSHPETRSVALEDWYRSYPSHPASAEFYKEEVKAVEEISIPQTLEHIAILLPESGPYKTAAEAIKKGILAAHFNAQSQTQLHFYDVVTDQQSGESNVWQQYQNAISQNASLVIGPLDKKSVQILAEIEYLTVPVLALNRLAGKVQKDNLFQFGLAPEDDAITAANYATQQGFTNAVVLSPNNGWGNRVSLAFNEQWSNNGGTLLNHEKYDPKQNDFSNIIEPLLDLNTSIQRYNSLKKTLAVSVEFEPRRRQDIDLIFLVAKPLKARQLVPQLKFHRSGKVPIYAISQSYSGKENSQQDIDLNGLLINDIPWMFSVDAMNDPIYASLKSDPPANFERFLRLYALGADAYQLLPQLNDLRRSNNVSFNGATGLLSVNESGHIQRETRWGVFTQGILTPLPEK